MAGGGSNAAVLTRSLLRAILSFIMSDLHKKQSALNESANKRNIKEQLISGVSPAEIDQVEAGLKKISTAAVISQMQYLDNVLLPSIEQKDGIDSDRFRRFKGIFDALVWSMFVQQKFERLQYQLSNQTLLTEFYREKCLFYERELERYVSREDLIMAETFNDLKDVMANNALKNVTYKYADRKGKNSHDQK